MTNRRLYYSSKYLQLRIKLSFKYCKILSIFTEWMCINPPHLIFHLTKFLRFVFLPQHLQEGKVFFTLLQFFSSLLLFLSSPSLSLFSLGRDPSDTRSRTALSQRVEAPPHMRTLKARQNWDTWHDQRERRLFNICVYI